jgi:hypothetical protein
MKNAFSIEQLKATSLLSQLSATELYALLQFLIECEVQPGGPYLLSLDEDENRCLNQHVKALFNKNPVDNRSDNILPINRPSIAATLASTLGSSGYQQIEQIVYKLSNVDRYGELSNLSSLFVASLPPHTASTLNISKYAIRQLGKANFYIWVTYSLYDHLLDEKTNLNYLPIANRVERLAIKTYLQAGITYTYIVKMLAVVDAANTAEIISCRAILSGTTITISQLPDKQSLFRLLYERSIAHCLGPIFIYKQLHSHMSLKQYRVFKRYCAMRQLNDDIHDWQEDFNHGRITYVVAWLLKATHTPPGTYEVSKLLPILQTYFWKRGLEELVEYCLKMSEIVQREYIEVLGLKTGSKFDKVTIQPIIDACHSALSQHAFEKQFVQAAKEAAQPS